MADYSDYITALSMEDPGDEWFDESAALSCPDSGQASRFNLPPEIWTSYLVWVFKPIVADVVDISFYIPTGRWWYEVDLFDGGEWRPVAAARAAGDTWPLTVTIAPTRIEKVRLRVKHYDTQPRDADVFCCWLHPGCGGPLAPLCSIFHAIGDFFAGLADDIAGIMFVGGALSAPFRSLAETFHDLGDTCCEISAKLRDILDALEGGITPASLLALIQANWPTLHSLITDPVGWFLVQLTLAFDLEPWHTQSLEFLAKWILEEHFPTLYQIWLDPLGWLADILEEHFPLLYHLVVDPVGEVLYLIGEAFDLTPYEAQSPEFIVKALFERYFPELYQLWRDMEGGLWEWLVDRYEDAFESIQARLYVLAERTLRFFWEGEW